MPAELLEGGVPGRVFACGRCQAEVVHTDVLKALRAVYRQPVLEAVRLACVALQCPSGVATFATRPWPRLPLARLQALAGLAVALFLAVHLSAVLGARRPPALETDFHLAAAGMRLPSWAGFFGTDYAGAVIALFVHIACALPRRPGAAVDWRLVATRTVLGTGIARAIVGRLGGWLIEVDMPAAYLAPYGVRRRDIRSCSRIDRERGCRPRDRPGLLQACRSPSLSFVAGHLQGVSCSPPTDGSKEERPC